MTTNHLIQILAHYNFYNFFQLESSSKSSSNSLSPSIVLCLWLFDDSNIIFSFSTLHCLLSVASLSLEESESNASFFALNVLSLLLFLRFGVSIIAPFLFCDVDASFNDDINR